MLKVRVPAAPWTNYEEKVFVILLINGTNGGKAQNRFKFMVLGLLVSGVLIPLLMELLKRAF